MYIYTYIYIYIYVGLAPLVFRGGSVCLCTQTRAEDQTDPDPTIFRCFFFVFFWWIECGNICTTQGEHPHRTLEKRWAIKGRRCTLIGTFIGTFIGTLIRTRAVARKKSHLNRNLHRNLRSPWPSHRIELLSCWKLYSLFDCVCCFVFLVLEIKDSVR